MRQHVVPLLALNSRLIPAVRALFAALFPSRVLLTDLPAASAPRRHVLLLSPDAVASLDLPRPPLLLLGILTDLASLDLIAGLPCRTALLLLGAASSSGLETRLQAALRVSGLLPYHVAPAGPAPHSRSALTVRTTVIPLSEPQAALREELVDFLSTRWSQAKTAEGVLEGVYVVVRTVDQLAIAARQACVVPAQTSSLRCGLTCRVDWPAWLWCPSTPSPYECVLSSHFSVRCYCTQPTRKRAIQALLKDSLDPVAPYFTFQLPLSVYGLCAPPPDYVVFCVNGEQ